MTENTTPVSINDLKDKKTAHGALVSCSLSLSESGMMMNSNSNYYVGVTAGMEGQMITVRQKKPFESETATCYKATTDILGQVSELAQRENMSAWGELRYVQEFVVFDHSSSAGMTLYYDDTPVGGQINTSVNIDLKAVRQQGAGDVEDEYRRILDEGIASAEFIGRGQNDNPLVMAAGAPLPDEAPALGCWKCPCCGYALNEGRFCRECGSKRP